MEQKYIVKNQATYAKSDLRAQRLQMIESRLIWNAAVCIKMGDLTKAQMLAKEVIYVRHIKSALMVK